MTKRILALFLVCILAIPILVVPASAATTQDVVDAIYDVGDWIDDGLTSLWSAVNKLGDYLDEIDVTVLNIEEYLEKWNTEIFDSFWFRLETFFEAFWYGWQGDTFSITGIIPTINAGYSTITGQLGLIYTWCGNFADSVTIWLNDIYDNMDYWWSEVGENISYWVERTSRGVEDVGQTIANYFEKLLNGDPDYNPQRPDEEIRDDKDNVDDAQDILDSVTYPDYNDIDIDLDSQLPGTSQGYLTDFFGAFFASQYIYIVFFLAFSFALVSFVIFGKR